LSNVSEESISALIVYLNFSSILSGKATMRRNFIYSLAATPALAWTQPTFGYVPGNDFGVPQNASYDYVVVGGGEYADGKMFCGVHP
jgi:hypothetical protein